MAISSSNTALPSSVFQAPGEYPERIRRCFMTGKQCIFRQIAREPLAQASTGGRGGAFIVMPFRPNLDAFYDWSLKRYLEAHFGFAGDQIKRADQFRDIGYVMCEKICRRIQESDLVVVDLSIPNPNVFYELGLSVGLSKQLLVLCDSNRARFLRPNFWEALGMMLQGAETPDAVLKYPNVGFLSAPAGPPKTITVPLSPLKPEMKILALLVPKDPPPPTDVQDIEVTFTAAVEAAVGVAVTNIMAQPSNPYRNALEQLKTPDVFNILDDNGDHKSFHHIVEKVDAAFACIIDLADENPHSYFWLGYCHARGISAIPVFRTLAPRNIYSSQARNSTERANIPAVESAGGNGTVSPGRDSNSEDFQHALAFDIRALWYIHFNRNMVKRLAETFQGVIHELVRRDLPRLQRNIFWERLTRLPRVHIYTGAVHHEQLNREVVGDWDQRTVSEFVRYLSGGDEAVVPQLERPVYSLGTIKEKLGEKWSDGCLNSYIGLIKNELKNKNCLIIASADVNPLTEVVLAHAYGLSPECFKEFRLDHRRIAKAVVALKASQTAEEKGIPTFFSASIDPSKIAKEDRGFLVDGNVLAVPYRSQDDADKDFSVLAHLLVMQNVFSDDKLKDSTMIVVLNGVSGPGTFGLAELLTGGSEKAELAERLLTDINDVWRRSVQLEKQHDRARRSPHGIEAIVEVKINPSKLGEPASAADVDKLVRDKFYDKREVVDFSFWRRGEEEEAIRGGNPRQINV